MRTGTSLFLLAAGAILAFAVNDRVSDIDLTMVGYILIGVGALGLILTVATSESRRGGSVRRDDLPPSGR